MTEVELSNDSQERQSGVVVYRDPNSPAVSFGWVRLPTSGHYQVWATFDGGQTIEWLSAHADEVQVVRLCEHLQRVQSGAVEVTRQASDALYASTAGFDLDLEEVPPGLLQAIRQEARLPLAALRPAFKQNLDVFQRYMAFARLAGQSNALAALRGVAQRGATSTSLYTQLVAIRKLEVLRTIPIKFLDVSALAMAEAVLAVEPSRPDFPKENALWVQPLGPLIFRRALVRGVALYRLFEPQAVAALIEDHRRRPRLSSLPPEEFERQVRALVRGQEHNWLVELALEPRLDRGPESWGEWGEALLLWGYDGDAHRWEYNPEAADGCPTGKCTTERLGAEDICIPCDQCARELEWWGCWLKTVFWILAGKFRKGFDRGGFETFTEKLVEEVPSSGPTSDAGVGKDKGKRHHRQQKAGEREYTVTRVTFDASYFRPARSARGSHASRYTTYLVLTTEEALREGALEIDLEGVLIKDWSPVGEYWRRRPGEQEKTQYVGPRARRTQLVSLATWKARQLKREQHQVQKVIASTFLEGGMSGE